MRIANTGFLFATLVTFSAADGVPAADGALPVIAIYTENFRRSSTNIGPQVIAALWANGRIVWSGSPTNGGPPYQQGMFAPEKLAGLVHRLEERGAFTDQTMARAWYGPDATYTTIAVDDGQKRLKMRSWHERFEQNTNLVVLASGIAPLQGRDRATLLRMEPADYRNFREAWSEVRRAVAGMVPQAGELYTGPILGGSVVWSQAP